MLSTSIKEYQKICFSMTDSQVIDVSKMEVSFYLKKILLLIYLLYTMQFYTKNKIKKLRLRLSTIEYKLIEKNKNCRRN